ncbi:integrase [Herbaspirillum sp. Sphag1AN]|uniref:tyrosine-type recombinase/integrase n=1 Tax=unclassified Herbaspirillum TaxID=2624150 RepID=UPI00160F2224|nr:MULTISPECIES: tyrosine-type recombinase/integrase [unclassified Herbaspirillum]MBB3214484.1 integrase [Herbaspirillum sp. Sphag1AN]MBB3247676.1 integrase [Herbaspirillum sp. Sphag64]
MAYQLVRLRPSDNTETLLSFARQQQGCGDLSASDFAMRNCPRAAIILDGNGAIQWPSTLYLAEVALRSRSTQGKTVETYAEALIQWLDHLDRYRIDLTVVSERDLQQYRNELCQRNSSSRWGRYSAQTVNLKVLTPFRFHQWAQSRELIDCPLGAWAKTLERNQFQHWIRKGNWSKSGRNITPVVEQRIPRILKTEELKALFAVSTLPFSLMFKWAVVCGLRRFEICNLRISDIPDLAKIGAYDTLHEIRLVRKGGRHVTVYVPTSLIEESRWYALFDRPRSEKIQRKYLFIGRNGRQIGNQTLSTEFRKAADKIGSDATLHHLRHTFAVLALHILQSKVDNGASLNPLKTLQILMGHASIDTTEIYLRAMDIHSDAVEEALAFLYGSTL